MLYIRANARNFREFEFNVVPQSIPGDRWNVWLWQVLAEAINMMHWLAIWTLLPSYAKRRNKRLPTALGVAPIPIVKAVAASNSFRTSGNKYFKIGPFSYYTKV